MTDEVILQNLKFDLQISANGLDSYLTNLINASKTYIETYGITIDYEDISDCALIEMYAAHLYRNRRNGNAGIPRFLQFLLNNRLIKEKGSVANG